MARKLSREEEVVQYERQQREIGGEVAPSTNKRLIEENLKKRKESDERTKNQLLEPFTAFIADPLAFLHEQVSLGEWSNRNERYQLYNLLTAIRIQHSLEEIANLLKKHK